MSVMTYLPGVQSHGLAWPEDEYTGIDMDEAVRLTSQMRMHTSRCADPTNTRNPTAVRPSLDASCMRSNAIFSLSGSI